MNGKCLLIFAATNFFLYCEWKMFTDIFFQDLFMNECMVESDVSAINFDLKRNVERAYQCQDLRCRDASCCQV